MKQDIARDFHYYLSGKARLALRRALVEVASGIGADVAHHRDRLEMDEFALERWADELNEQARCILCRETAIGPDHPHVEAVL